MKEKKKGIKLIQNLNDVMTMQYVGGQLCSLDTQIALFADRFFIDCWNKS